MGMLTDYVQVGDVREHYQTGTSRDYDEWMSDDSGPSTFSEHMGDGYDERREAALERATKEDERRTQLRSDVDANTARSTANASSIGDLNKEPDDPAPTPEANVEGPEVEKEEIKPIFNQEAAKEAKGKAQAQLSKGNFEAGNTDQIASTMSKPSATESEAPAQAAVYGNVSPGEAAEEHANSLLTKYKSGIKYGA